MSSNKLLNCSQAEAVQTVAEETRAQGTIGLGLYYRYLRAGASIALLVFVLLVNILAQVREINPYVMKPVPLMDL